MVSGLFCSSYPGVNIGAVGCLLTSVPLGQQATLLLQNSWTGEDEAVPRTAMGTLICEHWPPRMEAPLRRSRRSPPSSLEQQETWLWPLLLPLHCSWTWETVMPPLPEPLLPDWGRAKAVAAKAKMMAVVAYILKGVGLLGLEGTERSECGSGGFGSGIRCL